MEDENTGLLVPEVDMSGVERRLDALTEAYADFNAPGLDKPFDNYNTTETLLTLLLVCVVVHWCICMIKRGFSWLL